MMQELVAKMTGQEQDWQKMLDKLLVDGGRQRTQPGFWLQPAHALGTPAQPSQRILVDHTVHGSLQARVLEWVTFPSSRGSSQSKDQTQVS